VAEVLTWLERQGLAGVGQSSWGPTGFAVVGNENQALELAQTAQALWGAASPLQFMVCSARNHGGEVAGGEVTVGEGTGDEVSAVGVAGGDVGEVKATCAAAD